jgi:hypothetical protein
MLIVCFIINPISLVSATGLMQSSKQIRQQSVNFGSDPALGEKILVIIQPPAASMMVGALWERQFSGEPMPRYIRILSSELQNLSIYREKADTLVLEPEGGFNQLPGPIPDPETGKERHVSLEILNRWTSTFFYNPNTGWEKGDTITLTGVRITILEVTSDGRPAKARFQFNSPLEEAKVYKWITWDMKENKYVDFVLPDKVEHTRLVYTP